MNITRPVPTNIITGFLGVGKTTAILHLMAQKPASERWAILVNEFGEIGIDGGLISGSRPKDGEIFIREVPGGCMCCAAGLPMQIALNRLLLTAKPDRLLIEPTGLGHPKEVIDVLTQPHYASVIHLHATLTLIDPRKLRDTRYTEHETFNQQIEVADLIIANKADQCSQEDFVALQNYITANGHSKKPLHRVSFGEIPHALLATSSTYLADHDRKKKRSGVFKNSQGDDITRVDSPLLESSMLQAGEHIKTHNRGEGFTSVGWRFHSSFIFDRQKLFALLSGISIERLKAFFITDVGVFGYNLSDNILSEFELDDALESRVEGIEIQQSVLDDMEAQLLSCVVTSV